MTGAATGIGGATAMALAEEGASVAVVDIDAGGADASDPAAVSAFVDAVVFEWGRLDGAFNNAGVGGVPSPTPDCSDKNWARTLAMDLTGTIAVDGCWRAR